MTTQESIPPDSTDDSAKPARTGPNWGRVDRSVRVARLPRVVPRRRRVSAVDPRVANPNVEGRPRPVEFLTGFDHWQVIPQVGALIMVVVLTIVFIRGWRKNPGSPVLMMVLVTTLIVWQDPIMNWSPYAVYNPALLHWPEILAPDHDVADRRTLHRVRIRDVLLRPVLPGDLDSSQVAGQARTGSVRQPASAAQPGRRWCW